MKRPTSSKKYDQRYFEKLNRGYKEFKDGSKFHPFFYKAFELAKPIKNGNILDVGCGRGEIVYLGALNGYRTVGIDYSDSAIKMSRDILRSLPPKYQKNASLKKMNAKKLRFKDNSADVIFMLDIVEHLYKWELEKVIEESWRVLKPDGQLIIHTSPNKLLMGPVRFLAHSVGVKLRSEEFHINEQSVFSLRAYLKKSFNVQRIWIEKDKKYWSNGTPERGPGIRSIAKMVDGLVDNFLSDFVIRKTFLRFLLGTDIWVIARPKKEGNFRIVGEMEQVVRSP